VAVLEIAAYVSKTFSLRSSNNKASKMILMSLIVRAILAIVGGWLIWWLLLGPLARIIAQLTQSISQFALKPGDEEIKKKADGGSGNDQRARDAYPEHQPISLTTIAGRGQG
jgi:hypothetical protein